MGIFIYLSVSKSVTKEEWNSVYEESLKLVDVFPLAERGSIEYAGREVTCAVHTKEHEFKFRDGAVLGWVAEMDYNMLHGAEEYYLPRDLIKDGEIDPEAGDAIMSSVSGCLGYDWKEKMFQNSYSLWGAKTQGEPYHMYLLAIACMIEDHLGSKAYVYGDITRGQCKRAVELVNHVLEDPIQVPSCCDPTRLRDRVKKLPLSESEQLLVFKHTYLGTKDDSFYQVLNDSFSHDVVQGYWKDKFSGCYAGSGSFASALKEYLNSGAALEGLRDFVQLFNKDGKPLYEEFIYAVLDTKMHWKEKNMDDCLEVNPESEYPYSVWTIFAGFAFGSARNRKVDRYIPIDDIRRALKEHIGSEYGVDACVDQYLEREKAAVKVDVSKENLTGDNIAGMVKSDASDTFNQIMDKKAKEKRDFRKQYDITAYGDLLYYEKGCSIEPNLKKNVAENFLFYDGLANCDTYKELMEGSHEERARWLIDGNRHLLFHDGDWVHIFERMEEDPSTFRQYYPMVRVNIDDLNISQLVTALACIDSLYEDAKEWSKEYEAANNAEE